MRDDAHPGSDEAARIARRRKLLGIPRVSATRRATGRWRCRVAASAAPPSAWVYCRPRPRRRHRRWRPRPNPSRVRPRPIPPPPPRPRRCRRTCWRSSTTSPPSAAAATWVPSSPACSCPAACAAAATRSGGRRRLPHAAERAAGRIHTSHGEEPTRDAVAWLRENGRYLTPTGAGDAFYAAATVVRNWFAMHCVLGSALVVLLAALALGRQLLGGSWLALGNYQMDLLHDARRPSTRVACRCGGAN